jgi:hypothetical protein
MNPAENVQATIADLKQDKALAELDGNMELARWCEGALQDLTDDERRHGPAIAISRFITDHHHRRNA